MWPSSLSGRLLVSVLIGLLVAGVVGAGLQWSFRVLRNSDHLISSKLEGELDEIEQGLRIGADGRLDFRPQSPLETYDGLRKDTAFRIMDAEGNTMFSSPDGLALRALERMPANTDTLKVHDAGVTVLLQVRERKVRHSGAEYGIQVARSNRMVERLSGYARQLYLGSALASALAALVVFTLVIYITIRRTVVPLQQASEQAAKIEPNTLSARLQVNGIPSEMMPLIDALNSALERLEHGFKVQQDFIAMAAHELKTPLTLLQAEVELGSEMNKEAMLRETQLMARQVNQLLHLTEVSEGRNFRFSRQSLWTLSADAASYFARIAERNGVSLRVDYQGPEAWTIADDGAVFVMLKNLLENAVNHSPRGGIVTLEVSPHGFKVIDQGRGVDPAHREHLFKRFWRASNTSSGAGLGLAIVREICLAHQWEVHLEDSAGEGARFVISIPGTEVEDGQ